MSNALSISNAVLSKKVTRINLTYSRPTPAKPFHTSSLATKNSKILQEVSSCYISGLSSPALLIQPSPSAPTWRAKKYLQSIRRKNRRKTTVVARSAYHNHSSFNSLSLPPYCMTRTVQNAYRRKGTQKFASLPRSCGSYLCSTVLPHGTVPQYHTIHSIHLAFVLRASLVFKSPSSL